MKIILDLTHRKAGLICALTVAFVWERSRLMTIFSNFGSLSYSVMTALSQVSAIKAAPAGVGWTPSAAQ